MRLEYDVQRLCASALLFLACTGPWVPWVARLFEVHRFEDLSMRDSIAMLFVRMAHAFADLWYILLLPPACIVLANSRWWVPLRRARIWLAYASTAASFAALGVFAVPANVMLEPLASTPLTRTLLADFLLMCLWHLVLCARGLLPAYSLLLGPLGGVALTLIRDVRVPSPLIAVFFFLACVPNLVTSYQAMGEHAHLSFEGHLLQLPRLDIYAFVTIMSSFVLLSAHIPRVTGLGSLVATSAFVVALNGNIAAAWVTWGLLSLPVTHAVTLPRYGANEEK